VKLGAVVLASLAAMLLILAGATRFLNQAQQQHDQVECIRVRVEEQARGNATMAAIVLDVTKTQTQRAQAVADWASDQSRLADLIGEC
jgi:uncharacterized protein YggE